MNSSRQNLLSSILCCVVFLSLVLMADDSWSKSYSSARSSSSSRSSSYRSSTSSYKALPKQSSSNSRSSYQSNNNQGVFSAKFGKSYNSALDKLYRQQSSSKAYGALQKTMPSTKPRYFPEADLEKYRTRYRDNPLYRQAGRDNDSWGARGRYYQTNPPIIVNGGSDSFGLLSGMFLYSLLNNVAQAGQYAFHHQNDPDYQKWRTEADRLAQDNAELKQKLSALDNAKNAQTDTQPNPNWLPPGVPAAATLSDVALKASQPDFNVCVGSENGPYYKVAQSNMLPALVEWVNLIPIATKGTPEILAKLNTGACDAGFIQGDAKIDEQQLDVVFKPFLEAAHLACNKTLHVKSLAELNANTLWIVKNSGSRLTWDNFVALNPELTKIPVQEAVNYEDAILKAVKNNACLFYMAAPHAATIDRLINRPELSLIAIDDEHLTQSGVYQARKLSSSDYNNAIVSSWFSDNYVDTVVAPATFVISKAWQVKSPELAAKIALQLADIESTLKKAVQQ